MNIIGAIKDKGASLLLLLFFLIWMMLILQLFVVINNDEFSGKRIFDIAVLYYPLLFLPLFIKKSSRGLRFRDYIELLGAVVFFVLSCITGFLTLTRLCTIWIGLILLNDGGIRVVLPGKLLFLLMPPLYSKYSLVLGFPVRLFLTKAAGAFLGIFDEYTVVEGNLVFFRGSEFLVDPACEGLKMGVGMCVIFLILLYRLNAKRQFTSRRPVLILIMMSVAFMLWLLSNLVRIIMLIVLNVGEESFLHEWLGILVFVSLVIVPLGFIYFAVSHTGEPDNTNVGNTGRKKLPYKAVVGMMVMVIVFNVVPVLQADTAIMLPDSIGDFTLDERFNTRSEFAVDYEIASYTAGDLSLILKNSLYPFRLIHHPRQCWEGEGYTVLQESRREKPGGGYIRDMLLTKADERYRLLWWYEPVGEGYEATDSEFVRLPAYLFKGGRYIQVNVFARDEVNYDRLLNACKELVF